MSTGAVNQLLALGPQDTYITGSPQAFFFTSSYVQYVNFAGVAILQSISGPTSFGSRFTVDVSRSGDNVGRVLFEIALGNVQTTSAPMQFAWVNDLAYAMMQQLDVQVGGVTIDTHFGEFYSIWDQLTVPAEKWEGRNKMVGQQNFQYDQSDPSNIVTYTNGLQTLTGNMPAYVLYLAAKFWFCDNSGLTIPLSSILYNNIRLIFQIRPAAQCYITTNSATFVSGAEPRISNINCWVEYFVFTPQVREAFAAQPHEYLITQLQYYTEAVATAAPNIRMTFNHPTKEMIFVIREDAAYAAGQWNNWTTYNSGTLPAGYNVGDNSIINGTLLINNQRRFDTRIGKWFNLYNTYYYHTRVPYSNGINVIPFGFSPESEQPMGTLNFSKIDSTQLQIALVNISSSNTGTIFVFCRNVNRLDRKSVV